MSGSWTSKTSRYSPILPALATGLGTFLVYLTTVAPTVAGNDAGRFQIAAPLLGTGHPTGYPTFILIGKLFTFLPFGDVAFRMNLMAAFFGALAAAMFLLVARELGSRTLPAAGGAFITAFSSTFWFQANVAEVYTMHAAFLLGTLWLMLLWRRSGDGRFLLFAALLCGVSLGNNAGMVLLAPAALILLLGGRKELSAKLLASAGAAFALGLSVYAYVPIRGFAGAWHNYGDPVHNWADVWQLISGARFQGLMGVTPPELLENVGGFLYEVTAQASSPAGYALGALLIAGGAGGAATLVRRDLAVGVAMLAGLAATLAYALSYQIDDVTVYYIPVYLFLALLLSVWVSALSGRTRRPELPGVSLLVVATLTVVLNHSAHDASGYYDEREYAEATLGQLPERAVLYGKTEVIPITYFKEVEGARREVKLRWLDGGTLEEHLEEDLQTGDPVYFIPHPDYNKEYLEIAGRYASHRWEDGLIQLTPRGPIRKGAS